MKKSVKRDLQLEYRRLSLIEKELARPVVKEAFLVVDEAGAMLLDGEPLGSDEIEYFEYQVNPAYGDDWSVGHLTYEDGGKVLIVDAFSPAEFCINEHPYKIVWRGVYPQE